MKCISCGEDIDYSNTKTKAGWNETEISGLCEKCFDDCTFDLEGSLEDNLEEGRLSKEVLQCIGDGVVLAGGALRSLIDATDIQDYDLFFLDLKKVDTVKEYLVSKGWKLKFSCPKGELFTYMNEEKVKVQLITKKEYKDCNELIQSFDITACCCAYDGEKFYKSKRFIFDSINKLINIQAVEYPVATMRRICKYVSKGYKLTTKASQYFIEEVNSMQLDENNTALYID